MVEKIYLADCYKKELDAKITTKNESTLELDQTIFYPTGGGEPCDMGTISYNDNIYNVIDVKKEGDKVLHILDKDSELNLGDQVHCSIDWERRYAYMRHHTAIHVIAAIMEEKYKAMFTGGMIGMDKSHFDFDMPSLNRELAQQIIKESQEIIDKNVNVIIRTLSKEEALKIPNLVRTEPGKQLLQRLQDVRVVEIEGFDIQMDGGTHVKKTGEIGTVSLSNFENKGTHRKRIEIMLENKQD